LNPALVHEIPRRRIKGLKSLHSLRPPLREA